MPGFNCSMRSRSRFMTPGSRYIVTTVACEKSVLKKSCCRNFTRLADVRLPRAFLALVDEVVVELDADRARAELARGGDHDAPVARAQVVDDVVRADAREPQHLVDDDLRRRHERHVEELRVRDERHRGRGQQRRAAADEVPPW